jgi:cytoskeletal protein CcmA (bactofilin family)
MLEFRRSETMWNKPQNPSGGQPANPPPAASAPAAPAYTPPPSTGVTIIGESMSVKGRIVSREELQLNGELHGELEMDGRLTVGVKGKVDANVKAREVIVAGSIKGNVEAAERLVLRKGAHLEGDVKTAGIVIEDGAYFKGGIDITGAAASAGKC